MLETFDWTGGVVFDGGQHAVVAGIEPTWNMLGGFREPGAIFGFVVDGHNAVLRHHGFAHALAPNSYFVVNSGNAELSSPGGRVLLIFQRFASFPFMIGGPIEPRGRLRYIDGCTDSLIIPPWRMGEACMNHLHIPAGTEQTMHTHPSDRIGTIVRGRGQCVTPNGIIHLKPGMLWRIAPEGLHRFRTEDESLDVIAWHPDSDFGPTDDDHPMLNRSLVNGVSAAEIDAIRTR